MSFDPPGAKPRVLALTQLLGVDAVLEQALLAAEALDGEVVLEKTYTHAFIAPAAEVMGGGETTAPRDSGATWPPVQPTTDLHHENGIAIGFDGGRAFLSEIALGRDGYYTLPGPTDFRVPSGKGARAQASRNKG